MPVDLSPVDDDLAVRRFEPADRECVRELADAAMADTPEYVPGAPYDDLDDVRGHYFDRGGEFLVGTVDGEIVATGAYEPLRGWKTDHVDLPVDETAELTRMRVPPGHRGKGYGTAVYRELATRARADGYRWFVLDTGVDNDRARGFYEARGFEPVDEVTVELGDRAGSGRLSLELAIYRRRLDNA